MSDEIKNIMRRGNKENTLDPAVAEKLEELKDRLLSSVARLKEEYDNKVPFTALHETTDIDYSLISDVILALIMEKKLLGFINDGGTAAFDDDVLILRDRRMVDDLEPEYETGTI